MDRRSFLKYVSAIGAAAALPSLAGVADVAKTNRFLGFCMIFAGQDLSSFERLGTVDDGAAAAVYGNCNIRIFMKLNDGEVPCGV